MLSLFPREIRKAFLIGWAVGILAHAGLVGLALLLSGRHGDMGWELFWFDGPVVDLIPIGIRDSLSGVYGMCVTSTVLGGALYGVVMGMSLAGGTALCGTAREPVALALRWICAVGVFSLIILAWHAVTTGLKVENYYGPALLFSVFLILGCGFLSRKLE